MPPPALEVRRLMVSFGDVKILCCLDLKVEKGEIVTLVGRNGTGKTTLLRAICGLQEIDSGEILVNGDEVTDILTSRRGIGMIFQQPLLMPQLDVGGNLALGISREVPRSKVKGIIKNALSDLRLEGYERRRVDSLSGGESQRIAVMRAMLAEPVFMLMDEPLVSQDRWARERFGIDIRTLLKKRGIAALLVTHDEEEAMRISDRVVKIDSIQEREEE
ncbi:MAG: ABC transporter ATP-binding protein [Candidatus Poseidoniaceae archaeon]|nr:ABC transporter ATP-binding protein [Candidatus Poseidoniaceae archaeon]MDP7203783.1 ABC transporter ATP-binding protein [Candidatus Poseidoniaceae archaeon]